MIDIHRLSFGAPEQGLPLPEPVLRQAAEQLLQYFAGERREFDLPVNRHSMSTPAVQDGLAYVADSMRVLHCVDTATGTALWTHELSGEVWASALVADGKVFIGTRRGDFWVFAAGREKRVLGSIQLDGPISATAVAANRTLYVATMKRLYAVAEGHRAK